MKKNGHTVCCDYAEPIPARNETSLFKEVEKHMDDTNQHHHPMQIYDVFCTLFPVHATLEHTWNAYGYDVIQIKYTNGGSLFFEFYIDGSWRLYSTEQTKSHLTYDQAEKLWRKKLKEDHVKSLLDKADKVLEDVNNG